MTKNGPKSTNLPFSMFSSYCLIKIGQNLRQTTSHNASPIFKILYKYILYKYNTFIFDVLSVVWQDVADTNHSVRRAGPTSCRQKNIYGQRSTVNPVRHIGQPVSGTIENMALKFI